MSYRALTCAAALLAALAACESKTSQAPAPTTQAKVTPPTAVVDTKQGATPATGNPAPACKKGANCDIKVIVAGDPCKITKQPEKKHVARGSAEKLSWTIQNTGGSNWDFDTNGVAFSGPNAGNFQCQAAGAGKYECADSNPQATATEVPYTVKVKDGAKTCSNDPMIVNGADDVNNE